ncbi:MAG: AAA family ATPase [Candidatus Anstonellaceae archaeon]
MLVSIHLINWKSHKDSKLSFKPGTNFIVGKMGSGKSSVVDAICFSLFGTFPKLSRKECSLKDLRNFNLQSSQTTVELEFLVEENNTKKTYKVIRDVFDSKAYLYCEEKLICSGTNFVNSHIEKIIKVNYDLFTKAVYGEQNNLNYWLDLPPSKKKAQLDDLLGLNKFEQARANLIKYLNKRLEELDLIEKDINSDHSKKIQEEYLAYQKKLEEKNNELLILESNFRKSDEEYKKIQLLYIEKKKVLDRVLDLEKNLFVLNSKKTFIEQELKKIKLEDEAVLLQKIAQLEEELKKFSQVLLHLKKEIKEKIVEQQKLNYLIEKTKENKEKFEYLKKKLSSLLGNFLSSEELEKKIFEIEKQLEILSGTQLSLKGEIEEQNLFLERLNKTSTSFCPLCGQELGQKTKENLIATYTSKLSENLERLKETSHSFSNLNNQLKSLKTNLLEIKNIEGQLRQLSILEDLENLKIKSQELNSYILAKEQEQKNLEQKVQSIDRELFILKQTYKELEKKKNLEKDLEKTEEEIQRISKELNSLSFSKKEIDDLSKELERALENKTTLEQKLKTQKELLQNLQQISFIYKTQLDELEKKKIRQANLLDEIDLLRSFEKVLIATQIQLREYILFRLNSALQMLWPILYPYSDWSNLRISSSQKGYLIELYQNDWRDVEVFPSGGERACVALCLRVALALLLTPSLSWIILDEPTHNLDNNAVSRLSEALNNKLPNLVKQILVITHDERLVNFGYSQLIKIDREKTQNSFSVIS